MPPGSYHELLLMWKPVRLQGVGAASSIIDANTHPSGLLNDWRLRVVCLFGLAPNGVPAGYDSGCGSGWAFFNPTSANPQVDRLPLEATVGWDASLNGNLAEQLQEPTLMPKTRVVVVDDSALVRSLLTAIINRQNDMECVGAAADPQNLVVIPILHALLDNKTIYYNDLRAGESACGAHPNLCLEIEAYRHDHVVVPLPYCGSFSDQKPP